MKQLSCSYSRSKQVISSVAQNHCLGTFLNESSYKAAPEVITTLTFEAVQIKAEAVFFCDLLLEKNIQRRLSKT